VWRQANPFRLEQNYEIRITSKGRAFSALGKVAYATAEGIVFTRIERNDQMILEKWISELRDR
jgi:hypothetical protein